MREFPISPIRISYNGLDAEQHLLDGVLMGRSIEGTCKLYNQTLFVFEKGILPASRSSYNIRLYAGAPKDGSLAICLYTLVTTGQMALYPELWGEIADWIFPEIVQAVWSRMLNRPDKSALVVDKVFEELEKNRTFALEMSRMAIGAVCQDKSRLLDIVEGLADSNRPAARQMVEPIGKSCSQLHHQIGSRSYLEADEPAAEVIRSKEELEVSEMQEYDCRFEGVDLSGSCRVILQGGDRAIHGTITDPALKTIGNIYTNSLDQGAPVVITAKATMKKGEIQKLFISDARRP